MRAPSYNTIIEKDITDFTPYEEWSDEEEVEEEPHEILDGRICTECHKPMMSNEYIICGSLPDDWAHKHDIILHSRCLKDEIQEFLERNARYSFVEELGEAME